MQKILIVLATLINLVPHPFGVSSIGATALYAGAYGAPRTSWAMPFFPLLVGCLVLGFYDVTVMAFVFGGFALSTLSGRWFLARERSYGHYASAIALGATIFFLVSNFSIWLVGMYPPTLTGLVQCYFNGLPYLGLAMLADATYCFVLFGLHRVIERRQSLPATA